MIIPGHPYHGYSTLGAVQSSLTNRFAELSRSISPMQQNISKTINSSLTVAGNTVSDTIVSPIAEAAKSCNQLLMIATANQLFANVSSWYNSKRKDDVGETLPSGTKEEKTFEEYDEEEFNEVNL